MRTHLTNFLGRLGLTDEGTQVESSDEDVEQVPRPTKRMVEQAHISVGSKRATPHNPTSLENRHTKRLGTKHGTDWHGLARIPCYSRIRANPCQSALPFFVIFLDIYTMGSPMHVKGTCRSLNFIGVLTELYWRHKIWIY